MKKNTARKFVDILIFFSMCFITGTGLLIRYRLLPGSQGGHGIQMLGMTRHEWGNWHLWISYLLIVLILIHLVLNYGFIKNVVASKKKWPLLFFLLAGLTTILFFFLIPVEPSGRQAEGERRQNGGRGYHGGRQIIDNNHDASESLNE